MARTAKTSSGRLKSALKYGLAAAALGLLALAIAVGIAISSLPDYDELTRRENLGQMIRVRAADGTVIVSILPSGRRT